MAWYTILFITVITLFIVKFIVSWVVGDFDMDVDFDGVDDFDVSSAFSFKGLVHFLIGFSSYLFLKSYTPFVVKIDGVAQFDWFDYCWATISGIILFIALWYAYKLAMKANNNSKNPEDLINNSKGKIYINLGNGSYSVQAHTPAGTTNVTAFYTSDDLEPGTEVILEKNGNKVYITELGK